MIKNCKLKINQTMFKNKFKGKFIAVEGLDGSGGSTQVANLGNYFKKEKIPFWLTQEPTDNVIGNLIRSYLKGDLKIDSLTGLQLLFAADRASHLEKEIIPRLEKNVNIVSDRYFLSSLAYGSLAISDQDWLYQINNQFILPDLTILIKASAKTCVKRIKENRWGIELFESEEKLGLVWRAYEKLSKKYPNIKVVDGEKTPEEIFEDIIREVEKIIK